MGRNRSSPDLEGAIVDLISVSVTRDELIDVIGSLEFRREYYTTRRPDLERAAYYGRIADKLRERL